MLGSAYSGAPELCDLIDNDCDGTVDEEEIPGKVTGLHFDASALVMLWDEEPLALNYDVVKGDLIALRNSSGDFTSSLTGCLKNDGIELNAADPSNPAPGGGFYCLVRALRHC